MGRSLNSPTSYDNKLKPRWSLRQARPPLTVFVVVLVAASFLPLILLRKGGVVIGRLPLYLAYINLRGPNWPYIGLHLLLSILITASCILIWRVRHFRFSRLRFSLRWLFVGTAVIALLLISGLRLYESHSAIPTISLVDAIASFNAKYGNDPVGQLEAPLTEAEILASIRSQLPQLPANNLTKTTFSNILRTKQMPRGAVLHADSGWELKDGTTYTVWWINLNVMPTGKSPGYGLRIRENNAPKAKPMNESKLIRSNLIWVPESSG
jgi:hypothetical protein